MLKNYFMRLFLAAHRRNTRNILRLLEPNPGASLLDLGCDDGVLTAQFAKRVGTDDVQGCDFVSAALKRASRRGVQTSLADLNARLPYPTGRFDVVTTNQVIEHLFDTDRFVAEIYRILKPGGYAVISTENLSSWHNIFSLMLGRPAFSQHVSAKRHVGNPLSLLKGKTLPRGFAHVKIFTLSGLKVLLELYGFAVERSLGAGYYPLPGFLANLAAGASPGHSPFIAVKVRKPVSGRTARKAAR